MYTILKKLSSLLLLIPILSCSKLDDYMLGKDNTPAPKKLTPLSEEKVKLKEKWSLATGLPQKNTTYLKLEPLLVGSRIYLADSSGMVVAVDRETGRLLWSKNAGTGLVSGPVLSGNSLIFGSDNSQVVALNKDQGDKLWEKRVSSDVLAKPLIAGDKVIAKTIDGNLYALDLKTGKKLWSSQHGAPNLILKTSSSPALLHRNEVLAGFSDGKLVALDLESGQELWQQSLVYASGISDAERLVDIGSDPIVEGDRVYLASYQGNLAAFSTVDKEFIWKDKASTFKNISVYGSQLFMVDSRDKVWSINKQNGKLNWKVKDLAARGLTEPALLEDKLILGDRTGILHVLGAKNGDMLLRLSLSSAIHSRPLVAGSNVYVLTGNGKLSCFTLS